MQRVSRVSYKYTSPSLFFTKPFLLLPAFAGVLPLFPLFLPFKLQAPIAQQSQSHSLLDKVGPGGPAATTRDGSSVGSGRTSPLSAVTEQQQQQRQMANGGAGTPSSGDAAAQGAIGGNGGGSSSSNGPSAGAPAGGGAALEPLMGAGRYGRGPGDGSLNSKQQQQQGRGATQFGANVNHQRDGYGNGGAAGAADGEFVGAMGSLSLGPGGGASKALQYGGGAGSGRLDPYGGGPGNSNNSNHHMLDGPRGGAAGGGMGIGLHAGGMMPPSPYNGPQMSPYGGPQAGLMGGMPPLTPELHSGSLMNYQLVSRRGGEVKTADVEAAVGLPSRMWFMYEIE